MTPSRDSRFALLLGALSGLVWLPMVFQFTEKNISFSNYRSFLWLLPVIFAAGAFLSIRIGIWMGKTKPSFVSLIKFLIVGVFNTGVDLFIFNSLISLTGIQKGGEIIIFKSISFIAALFNSYLWNRWWTFETKAEAGRGAEFLRYLGVTAVGFLLNVGITFVISGYIAPPGSLSQVQWDNVAAVIATAVNLISNFLGYRFIAFKADTL